MTLSDVCGPAEAFDFALFCVRPTCDQGAIHGSPARPRRTRTWIRSAPPVCTTPPVAEVGEARTGTEAGQEEEAG